MRKISNILGMTAVCLLCLSLNAAASPSASNSPQEKRETVVCRGVEAHTSGPMVKVGETAPDFRAVNAKMEEVSLSDYKGKKVILNIFPSMDTGVCATSVRKFNQLAANQPNTVVLAISKDLPFAQGRFCTTEGITNVIPLSDYRYTSDFAEKYGVLMTDGPLAGLLARSVVVIDPEGKVVYTELVPEITQEPNYEAALKAVK